MERGKAITPTWVNFSENRGFMYLANQTKVDSMIHRWERQVILQSKVYVSKMSASELILFRSRATSAFCDNGTR